MSDSHSAALTAKHRLLDSRIASEESRPHPDDTLLHTLKKQKLKLKEAIAALL